MNNYKSSMSQQGLLYHHGIKGQKWGVKNGPPYPITKRDIAYDRNAGETVPKGTTLYRISGTQNDSQNDTMYVTYKKYDREFYKGFWGPVAQRNAKGDGNVYEHKFKLKEDLHIPSFNERDRMLRNVALKNKDEVYKALTIRNLTKEYPSVSVDDLKRLPTEAPDLWKPVYDWYTSNSTFCKSVRDNGEDCSYAVCASLAYSDKLMQAYKKESLNNGYNVIFDDYGTVTNYKGKFVRTNDSPLILLNPSKQCSHKSTKMVPLKEQDKSAREFYKWQDNNTPVIENTPLSLSEVDYRKGAQIESIKHSYAHSIDNFNDLVNDLRNKLRNGEVIFSADTFGLSIQTVNNHDIEQGGLAMNNYKSSMSQQGLLYHHGIKGQKWGVRRFQNADGSYTSAGRNRYGLGDKISVGSVLKSQPQTNNYPTASNGVKKRNSWVFPSDKPKRPIDRLKEANQKARERNRASREAKDKKVQDFRNRVKERKETAQANRFKRGLKNQALSLQSSREDPFANAVNKNYRKQIDTEVSRINKAIKELDSGKKIKDSETLQEAYKTYKRQQRAARIGMATYLAGMGLTAYATIKAAGK